MYQSERNRSTALETDHEGVGKTRAGWTQNLLGLLHMSEGGVSTPFLAVTFSRSNRIAATTLKQKGLTQYGVKFLAGFIQQTGVRRFINRSDGEPAMKALKDAAAKAIEGVESIAQESPVGDTTKRMVQSNQQCGR